MAVKRYLSIEGLATYDANLKEHIDEKIEDMAYIDIEDNENVTEAKPPQTQQVQSDWNVNDETDPAFIQNKPFGETVKIAWVEIANVTQESWEDMGVYNNGISDEAIMNDEGLKVKVLYDESEFIFTTKRLSASMTEGEYTELIDVIYVGNGSIIANYLRSVGCTVDDQEDTGEEFTILSGITMGGTIVFNVSDTEPTTHTISIFTEEEEVVVTKLDPKFLPDNTINIQADWDEEDETSPAFIQNKPISGGYAYYYLNRTSDYLFKLDNPFENKPSSTSLAATKEEFENDYYSRPIMLCVSTSPNGYDPSTNTGEIVNRVPLIFYGVNEWMSEPEKNSLSIIFHDNSTETKPAIEYVKFREESPSTETTTTTSV